MKNFGFISKRKVAKEIANIYKTKGFDTFDIGGRSVLNTLCKRLNITPIHLDRMCGGTGEIVDKKQKEAS